MAALRFIFTVRLFQLLRIVSLFAYITYVTPLDLLCGAFTPAHGFLRCFKGNSKPKPFRGRFKPAIL